MARNRNVGPLGDRFIPSRKTTDFEAAHFKLMNGDPSGGRVLSWGPTSGPVASRENLKRRFVKEEADRVLDMPDISNDFYSNLLDWSSTNVICTASGRVVYLFNAASNNIQTTASNNTEELMVCAGECDSICSVQFNEQGRYVAIGLQDGGVELWDVEQRRQLRTMGSHSGHVYSLTWNGSILSTGSSSGEIFHHDARMSQHHISTLTTDSRLGVCALKWSSDGSRLASGTQHSSVHIWDRVGGQTTPLFALKQHRAAVKGMSWCPWKNSTLVTGGGTGDGTVKFWNVYSGACVKTLETESPVSAILWNTDHSEIITAHALRGEANRLSLWKYPTLDKVGELTGHSDRILSLAMSPDGTRVASVGADETLRLWNCFSMKSKTAPARRKEPRSFLDDLTNFR